MTFQLPAHLTDAVQNGDAVLVLGAGASVTSKNALGKDVIDGSKLAEILAQSAGLSYVNEGLRQVLEATTEILGAAKLEKIVKAEFCDCRPSEEIKSLIGLSWYRIYTFNYEDCIENTPRSKRVQKLHHYNALKDRREEHLGYDNCQYIHLHGKAAEYSSGIIGSDTEYANTNASFRGWYQQLGEDFFNKIIVFIGSTLDEPLLTSSIIQYRNTFGVTGRSYLIIPSSLSEIRKLSLEKKSISFIRGNLSNFSSFLQQKFPGGLPPEKLSRNDSVIRNSSALKLDFSASELEALRSLHPISFNHLSRHVFHDEQKNRIAGRDYLNGFGPTWATIINKQFVRLHQYDKLKTEIAEELSTQSMIVLTGEPGSGKSTCCMLICYELSNELADVNFFEYRPNSSSVFEVLKAFRKYLGSSKRGIILIDSLHIFADDVSEALGMLELSNVCILSSSRLSEWNSRIRRQLPSNALNVELKRFETSDVEEIITKIEKYLAVPAFSKLKHEEKFSKLSRSKSQILIALREETSSEKFDDIIEDEFNKIDNPSSKFLFGLVALATMARSGLLESSCRQIFSDLRPNDSFDAAKEGLAGMVGIGATGRMQARHEIYARQIVYGVLGVQEFVDAVKGILEYFCKFEVPVIKNVSKIDGQLFKFVLNNAFVYDVYRKAGIEDRAREIYEAFENKLQRDGHFWLQYGLLERRLGRQDRSYSLLQRSVEAYPNNPNALTALAQQKLILVALGDRLDPRALRLMDEAVSFLTEEHYRRANDRRAQTVDEYPLSTLGYYHVDVLVRHQDGAAAAKAARKYWDLLKETPTFKGSGFLDDLRSRLFLYMSTGVWKALRFRKGRISYLDA